MSKETKSLTADLLWFALIVSFVFTAWYNIQKFVNYEVSKTVKHEKVDGQGK